jgi:hypothetical protein
VSKHYECKYLKHAPTASFVAAATCSPFSIAEARPLPTFILTCIPVVVSSIYSHWHISKRTSCAVSETVFAAMGVTCNARLEDEAYNARDVERSVERSMVVCCVECLVGAS